MNRSKWAAGGLLIAVFAAGLIVGGTGSAALEEREQREEEPRTPYIETLQERIGLSQDQRRQIEIALEEYYADWRTMRRELREEERQRNEKIRVHVRSKIVASLDSNQADTYRQMLAHTDSVRQARANRRQR